MSEWANHLLKAGLIVAVAALLVLLTQLLRRRALQALRAESQAQHDQRQRAVTLIGLATWIVHVVVIAAAILMLLSDWGVNVIPLLASAGVAGLAISLGAQTFIKDLIGGFFILVENQYSVGDTIQVGAVTGQVERFSLRATAVRDAGGQLYSIPNGEVRIVANLTKGWSRAIVDVGVAYEEDLDRALRVLEGAAAAFAAEPTMAELILEPPQVLGPVSLGDWAIQLRLMAKTMPGRQWEAGRQLRRYVLAACEREGVVLPYPRQEVWVHHEGIASRERPPDGG